MNIREHFEAEYTRFGIVITKPPTVIIEGGIALRETKRGVGVLLFTYPPAGAKNGTAYLVRIAEYAMLCQLGHDEALRIRFALKPDEVAHLSRETGVRVSESTKRESESGMKSVIRTSNWLTVSQYAELLGKIVDARRNRRF